MQKPWKTKWKRLAGAGPVLGVIVDQKESPRRAVMFSPVSVKYEAKTGAGQQNFGRWGFGGCTESNIHKAVLL